MQRTHSTTPPRSRAGFSLIEVTASMAVLLILTAGIFTLTTGSFELTEELSEFQKRNVLKKRFIELCRMNLEDVPGHAKVEFQISDRGQYRATYLSIVDDPFAFTFGGDPANVHRVILEADVAAGGWLRASLLYLNAEENLAYEDGSLEPSAVQRRVVLLRRLRQLTWRFYDNNRQEWLDFWDQPRNPTLVELQLAMEGEEYPERAVFWIPPEKAVAVRRANPNSETPPDEEESETDDEAEAETETGSDRDNGAGAESPRPIPAPR